MWVPMMQVRGVRVSMDQSRMEVRVDVRFASIPVKIVRMLMVFVVRMGVRMLLRLVHMSMSVTFGDVQPDARGHQKPGGDQLEGDGVTLHQYRKGGTKKRSYREIGSGASRSEIAQCTHEQSQADTVAEESDQQGDAQHANRWQFLAKQQAQAEIDAAGNESL